LLFARYIFPIEMPAHDSMQCMMTDVAWYQNAFHAYAFP